MLDEARRRKFDVLLVRKLDRLSRSLKDLIGTLDEPGHLGIDFISYDNYSLAPGGVLFLGSAETIGAFTHLFAPLAKKARLYRRLDSAPGAEPVEFPSAFLPYRPEAASAQRQARIAGPSLQALADQLLLQRFSPPAVLTTEILESNLNESYRRSRAASPPLDAAFAYGA